MRTYLLQQSVAVTHDQPNIIPDFTLVSPDDVEPANKLQTKIHQARYALVVDELFSPG